MLPWLDANKVIFPSTVQALDSPNGLLAAGGNLNTHTLLQAYKLGIFPWYQDPDPILWWTPNPRSILHPNEIYISKSLKKFLRKTHFTVSANKAFQHIIQHCAAPRDYTNETWISTPMIDAYCELHKQGWAHSVEAWEGDTLIAGLYGIAIGRAFFGESMFTHRSNASKLCFASLAKALNQSGFSLIDCQLASEHLKSLGAYEVNREQFELSLNKAISVEPRQSPWKLINEQC